MQDKYRSGNKLFHNLSVVFHNILNDMHIYIIIIIFVVVKATVMLKDINDFGSVNKVWAKCMYILHIIIVTCGEQLYNYT